MTPAPTALCRQLVMAGRRAEAEHVVAELIARAFDIAVREASINADWTSLNSVNGIVEAQDGRRYFFKFHQEEGEETTVREYYQAEALQRAGLPVDMPLMLSRKPGHQVLLYEFRRDRPFADVCIEIERRPDDARLREVVALQDDLDRKVAEIYIATLHASDAALSAAEPVHQLFHHRLWTPPDKERLAGRVARFYEAGTVRLPGAELAWDEFKGLRWRINGVDYRHTIDELFRESLVRLDPSRLGTGGAVTGHGDAHSANVWIDERGGGASPLGGNARSAIGGGLQPLGGNARSAIGGAGKRLVLFDPAFAGEHMPALLADVKATFHDIFAHPLWLYHPVEAEGRFHLDLSIENGRAVVRHDWALTPIRRAFLRKKIDLVWRPLLAALHSRGWLAEDWRRIVRCALFCCPTLVMNLRAGAAHGATPGRSPMISALSFAIAVMAGSEPDAGAADPFSRFLAAISPATGASVTA